MQFNEWYQMEEAERDVMLLERRDSKYRANHEARMLGEEGRRSELRLRRLETNTYCNSIGRRYEDVLRYKL